MVFGVNKKLLKQIWPLLILLAIAVFAPAIAPWDPWEMTEPFLRPSAQHLLGTNDLGQDILSELIYGTRTSLIVGFSAALIITVFGSFIGACAAYFGGWIDAVIMVFVNVADYCFVRVSEPQHLEHYSVHLPDRLGGHGPYRAFPDPAVEGNGLYPKLPDHGMRAILYHYTTHPAKSEGDYPHQRPFVCGLRHADRDEHQLPRAGPDGQQELGKYPERCVPGWRDF